jgi:hypothetical protein
MSFREALKLSWTNIRAHKLRNALAVLSVTIGIAAVIAIVTMTTGATRRVARYPDQRSPARQYDHRERRGGAQGCLAPRKSSPVAMSSSSERLLA